MTAEKAFSLYEKLKPFLRAIPPTGCYLPRKTGNSRWCDLNEREQWPLCWGLIAVTWNPKRAGRPITFEEFIAVYKLPISHDR